MAILTWEQIETEVRHDLGHLAMLRWQNMMKDWNPESASYESTVPDLLMNFMRNKLTLEQLAIYAGVIEGEIKAP